MTYLIIVGIIFLLDVIGSVYFLHKSKNKHENELMFTMIRICLVYVVLLRLIITLNDIEQKAAGKCPGYEQIQQPVYKLKS